MKILKTIAIYRLNFVSRTQDLGEAGSIERSSISERMKAMSEIMICQSLHRLHTRDLCPIAALAKVFQIL